MQFFNVERQCMLYVECCVLSVVCCMLYVGRQCMLLFSATNTYSVSPAAAAQNNALWPTGYTPPHHALATPHHTTTPQQCPQRALATPHLMPTTKTWSRSRQTLLSSWYLHRRTPLHPSPPPHDQSFPLHCTDVLLHPRLQTWEKLRPARLEIAEFFCFVEMLNKNNKNFVLFAASLKYIILAFKIHFMKTFFSSSRNVWMQKLGNFSQACPAPPQHDTKFSVISQVSMVEVSGEV